MRVTVVLAVDEFDGAVRVVSSLREQTIATAVELVIVGPSLAVPDGAVAGLGSVRVVDHPLGSLAEARAVGILVASAPVVYVAETHGIPRPGALATLAAAVESGAAAAMPRIVNANPETARSWASLFSTYGAYTGRDPRDLRAVALHNGAFKRDVLARVASVPEDLVYGVGLTAVLEREGLRMSFVPDAIVDHVNVASWRGIVLDRLAGSQLWAGLRSRGWSMRRRALYALGAPLSPFPFVGRILRQPGWRELRHEAPRGTGAILAVSSLLVAAGELAGYAAGVGTAATRHIPLELHREDYT